MTLRRVYDFAAPYYDFFAAPLFARARERSLARLPSQPVSRVLVSGIGTGLDFGHLPAGHWYVGVDFSQPMLAEAAISPHALDVALIAGDAQSLPFGDASFDFAVLHLIVAVVPQPERCLAETARVLKPGGRVYILDKFLRPGERARLRRAINGLARRIATRTDVVLEDALRAAPDLEVLEDRPAMLRNWFRMVELRKRSAAHTAASADGKS